MSRWGELIPHREDDDSCLCGCLDEIAEDSVEGEAPPVDEYRLSTRWTLTPPP